MKVRQMMFKVSIGTIAAYEKDFPGITKIALRFENAILPPCSECSSWDTADVQIGFVKITMVLAGITTKFALWPGVKLKGRYYCNACGAYFTPEDWPEPIRWEELNAGGAGEKVDEEKRNANQTGKRILSIIRLMI